MVNKKELEDEANRAISRTEKNVKAWSRALKSFLEENTVPVLEELQDSEGGLTQLSAAAALGQLEDAMFEAGLGELFDEAAGIYRETLDDVRREFKLNLGTAVVFSKVFRSHVDQFISLKNQQQTKTILNYVDDVRIIVAEQVLLGNKPDWSTLAADANARTLRNLEADFVSEVAAFHRQVFFEAAVDVGAEYVLYAGNVIDTSREFCRKRFGKVFELSHVKTWDNEQGLPVIPYLGGYRCRHRLVVVREEVAKSIGISEV